MDQVTKQQHLKTTENWTVQCRFKIGIGNNNNWTLQYRSSSKATTLEDWMEPPFSYPRLW